MRSRKTTMDSNVDVVVAVAIAAAAAAVGVVLVSPTYAYAESTAEYTTTFVSTLSRAEVRAQLAARPELLSTGSGEWSTQYNQPVVLKSSHTSEQARSEYKAARLEVRAVNAEDSGSSYFKRTPARNTGAVMGGPAVDPSNVERDQ
jgi:hypothetical protein